jgi:hypothetical protein
MSVILAPPPPINNGSLGYIRREKRFVRPSIARNKAPKKKVKKNNSLSKTQSTKAEPSNVNLQVDEKLLASLNFLGAWTSIASSINVAIRGKSDGQDKKCIGEAL